MRILLSAFACEPGQGSEAGIGWGIAWSLARTHTVHVVTTPRHREKIERTLGDGRKNHGGPIRITSKDGVLTEYGKQKKQERLAKLDTTDKTGRAKEV